MSDSITPFGTTRSVFSLATNDLEINGDIIASKFVGSGDKLTNITIKSINESTFNNNYVLSQTLGGTGSSTFIDKGILFNNETFRTLESTPNFIWDNVENALFINNKDIIKDYSNYILETAEVLGSNIKSTSIMSYRKSLIILKMIFAYIMLAESLKHLRQIMASSR